MRVDVHAHHYPEKYVSCLTRFGKDTSHTAKAPGAGVTLDQRLEMLDRSRIRVQVLCVGAQQPYFARALEATTAAKVANDLYAEVCKKYNGRFGRIIQRAAGDRAAQIHTHHPQLVKGPLHLTQRGVDVRQRDGGEWLICRD